jgi:hypothetical protein
MKWMILRMKMKIVLLIILRLRARSPRNGSDTSDRTRTDDGAVFSRLHLLRFFVLFVRARAAASTFVSSPFFDQHSGFFSRRKGSKRQKISESD